MFIAPDVVEGGDGVGLRGGRHGYDCPAELLVVLFVHVYHDVHPHVVAVIERGMYRGCREDMDVRHSGVNKRGVSWVG